MCALPLLVKLSVMKVDSLDHFHSVCLKYQKNPQKTSINRKVHMRLLGGIKNITQMSFQVCHLSVFILEPAVQGLLPLCAFVFIPQDRTTCVFIMSPLR